MKYTNEHDDSFFHTRFLSKRGKTKYTNKMKSNMAVIKFSCDIILRLIYITNTIV